MKPPRLASLLLCLLASPLVARAADSPAIDLWPEGVPGLLADAPPEKEENGRFTNISHPTLTVYAPTAGSANGTAVIYAPGGGYQRVAPGVNGGGITRWFNSIGITVFVLKYRVQPYRHPAPLQDVLRAVRLVRSRAAEFGVRPDRIGVFGGSAGGHLATCAGTLFDAPEGKTGSPLDNVSARPDFVAVVFSVVSMAAPHFGGGSGRNLLGPDAPLDVARRVSTELQVTKASSPAFLVSTAEDRTVPFEHSFLFYQALSHAGVPAELHLYAKGPHGDGLDPKNGPTALWQRRCEEWMRFHGWLPAAGN